jgi:uncharacterized RDD family membrane protein YckC
MVYEALLLLGVLGLAFVMPQLVIGMIFGAIPAGWVLLAHVFLVLLAYFNWFWRHGGQTLAMKTWKIRLVAAQPGCVPSGRQLLIRYLICWPSLCFYAAGLIWALFDRDRQFLHDRLAGTRLVMAG